MHPKWLIGLGFLMIVGAIVHEIIVGTWGMNQEISLFSEVMTSWEYISSGNVLTAIYGIVVMPFALIQAVFRIIFWDFAFFHGTWAIVRWALFTITGISVLVSLLLALRGTSSG